MAPVVLRVVAREAARVAARVCIMVGGEGLFRGSGLGGVLVEEKEVFMVVAGSGIRKEQFSGISENCEQVYEWACKRNGDVAVFWRV